MFRYKKYRPMADGLINSSKDESRPRSRRSRVRVCTQTLKPLAQLVDLGSRSILRRSFSILGEFGALQRRITLGDKLGNPPRRAHWIKWRSRRRRGLQQSVNALCACAEPKAGPQALAYRDAARSAVGKAQFFDNGDNGLVRDLLRSSHEMEVTVNSGKFKHSGFDLPWNIGQKMVGFDY